MRIRLTILAAAVLVLAHAQAALAAPPPNDSFATALVSILPIVDVVEMGEASTEPGEQQFCFFAPETVWYAFTATRDDVVRANPAGSFFDSDLTVYRANGPGWRGSGSSAAAASAPRSPGGD